MTVQYDARRDPYNWSVFDRRTGEIAMLRRALQPGLRSLDADDLADRFDRRRQTGGRSILP
jgi:hypothetical protein